MRKFLPLGSRDPRVLLEAAKLCQKSVETLQLVILIIQDVHRVDDVLLKSQDIGLDVCWMQCRRLMHLLSGVDAMLSSRIVGLVGVGTELLADQVAKCSIVVVARVIRTILRRRYPHTSDRDSNGTEIDDSKPICWLLGRSVSSIACPLCRPVSYTTCPLCRPVSNSTGLLCRPEIDFMGLQRALSIIYTDLVGCSQRKISQILALQASRGTLISLSSLVVLISLGIGGFTLRCLLCQN